MRLDCDTDGVTPGAGARAFATPVPFVAARPEHTDVEGGPGGSGDPGVVGGGGQAPGRAARGGGVRSAPDRAGAAEFGHLADVISDGTVTDVFVNGVGPYWVDRGAGLEREPDPGVSEIELRALATRLVSAGGRHIDEAAPCVDVRLHDGIRVHAVLPPVSPAGTLLSVRLPRAVRLTIDDLERGGFFAVVARSVVLELVRERRNILLTGAGGSGKTTALAALLAGARAADRIVAIEDVAELRVDHPHFVGLEARQANIEGAGEVTLTRLVREALRMRPDRLVLGECRGAEIRELFSALNTGHDGGAGTLHANSLADVPARLEALGALAGLDATATARQAVSAIDAILHLERTDRGRRIVAIGRFALDARDRLAVVPMGGGDGGSGGGGGDTGGGAGGQSDGHA
ncbi:TadA family conjugal transfer-associated ATPase [Marisediminicola sp. LYQ134]|uniref:TadA family conjugal transfer-associated ATPase n=1 Tax=unclassified Marisediminicola TaxID=2618316 RepID=UPI003982EDBC